MQSTGQTSTQELSLVPMQGSVMTYAMKGVPRAVRTGVGRGILPKAAKGWFRGRDVQVLTRPRGGSHALRTSGAKTSRKTAPWPAAEGDERYGDATHHREDPRDPAPPALARPACARAHGVA